MELLSTLFRSATKSQKILFGANAFFAVMYVVFQLVAVLSTEITYWEIASSLSAFFIFVLAALLVTLGEAFRHLFRKAWRHFGISAVLLIFELALLVLIFPIFLQ